MCWLPSGIATFWSGVARTNFVDRIPNFFHIPFGILKQVIVMLRVGGFNLAVSQISIGVPVLSTLGSRGYFFLIDISRRSCVNEKNNLWSQEHAISFSMRASVQKLNWVTDWILPCPLFDVANQGHCYIVNSLRTWEYPIGDPVQFLNWCSHGNEIACSCDQRLSFSPRRFAPR